jgi:hypothetical protein
VGLVDELSAAAPAVIVLDDLQWADDASLIVWHQLAASIGQLRLLLIGTCRPAPRRPEVQELRAAVIRHGGAVVTLGPLAETDVTALVTAMLGSPPGDTLPLIAGRRDERTAADQQLRQGLALPIQTLADRENQDFLVAAHALALEQSGETHQAMARLATMLPRRDGETTLIHQWLPDLVRLALAAGDRPMAQAASRACQAEAAAETHPARATVASLRCRGLLESDPDALTEAVAHYRALGPGRVDLGHRQEHVLVRRTVQTYISHILAKLGVKGPVDIVREALRQGVSP